MIFSQKWLKKETRKKTVERKQQKKVRLTKRVGEKTKKEVTEGKK